MNNCGVLERITDMIVRVEPGTTIEVNDSYVEGEPHRDVAKYPICHLIVARLPPPPRAELYSLDIAVDRLKRIQRMFEDEEDLELRIVERPVLGEEILERNRGLMGPKFVPYQEGSSGERYVRPIIRGKQLVCLRRVRKDRVDTGVADKIVVKYGRKTRKAYGRCWMWPHVLERMGYPKVDNKILIFP